MAPRDLALADRLAGWCHDGHIHENIESAPAPFRHARQAGVAAQLHVENRDFNAAISPEFDGRSAISLAVEGGGTGADNDMIAALQAEVEDSPTLTFMERGAVGALVVSSWRDPRIPLAIMGHFLSADAPEPDGQSQPNGKTEGTEAISVNFRLSFS